MNRFTKLDTAGAPLPDDATGHAFFLDNTTKLVRPSAALAIGRTHLDRAFKVCALTSLMGRKDWRLQTIDELEASMAALAYFQTEGGPHGWYWSSTLEGTALDDYAWSFNFSMGRRAHFPQTDWGFVLPVCTAA